MKIDHNDALEVALAKYEAGELEELGDANVELLVKRFRSTQNRLDETETDRDRWMRIATDAIVEKVHEEALQRFESYLRVRTAELGIEYVSPGGSRSAPVRSGATPVRSDRT